MQRTKLGKTQEPPATHDWQPKYRETHWKGQKGVYWAICLCGYHISEGL